jgi:hypothetical protein
MPHAKGLFQDLPKTSIAAVFCRPCSLSMRQFLEKISPGPKPEVEPHNKSFKKNNH